MEITVHPHIDEPGETVHIAFADGTKEDVEAREHFFSGPMAEWAQYRAQNFSDYIVPKHLFIRPEGDESHNVAWIYHSGVDVASKKHYKFHHVICDCIAEFEYDGRERNLFACNSLNKVLKLRAEQKSNEFGISSILTEMNELDEEKLEFSLSKQGRELIVGSIVFILTIDQNEPQSWQANRVSGGHELDQLSTMFHEPTASLEPIIQSMHRYGMVEYSGLRIKLPKVA